MSRGYVGAVVPIPTLPFCPNVVRPAFTLYSVQLLDVKPPATVSIAALVPFPTLVPSQVRL